MIVEFNDVDKKKHRVVISEETCAELHKALGIAGSVQDEPYADYVIVGKVIVDRNDTP